MEERKRLDNLREELKKLESGQDSYRDEEFEEGELLRGKQDDRDEALISQHGRWGSRATDKAGARDDRDPNVEGKTAREAGKTRQANPYSEGSVAANEWAKDWEGIKNTYSGWEKTQGARDAGLTVEEARQRQRQYEQAFRDGKITKQELSAFLDSIGNLVSKDIRKTYEARKEPVKYTPGLRFGGTMATDPPVSEAQRKAMWAAKSGNSTLGIPQKVGAEFAKADPGGKLPSDGRTCV